MPSAIRTSRLGPHPTPLLHQREQTRIAYGSMEIGVDPRIPNISGGLGILSGDHLKTAADMRLPMTGFTLLPRQGFLTQKLDEAGHQTEHPVIWRPEEYLDHTGVFIDVPMDETQVRTAIWKTDVVGVSGFVVPLHFLDTDVEGNSDYHRSLTGKLYGGDHEYRLRQEVLLGIGGYRALKALGYDKIDRFHMNEGHCAFLGISLLDEHTHWPHKRELGAGDWARVQNHALFTTHTPVEAGHDHFSRSSVSAVLGAELTDALFHILGIDHEINTTVLAARCSGFINAVSVRHSEVTRRLLPDFNIQSITNGVHAPTWTIDPFQRLFDAKLPQWRENTSVLRQVMAVITPEEIRATHQAGKTDLFNAIDHRLGVRWDPEALTLGFARRATPYKRHHLIFSNLDRLIEIAREVGPIQIAFAGKAHPNDSKGKTEIERVFAAARELRERSDGLVSVIYLENYDPILARQLVGGVDVWLNTPQRPLEASGTSGMKAAFNGVPSLSVLDGWWVEGYFPGMTGWAIGDGSLVDASEAEQERLDGLSFYEVLPTVARKHYQDPRGMNEMRINTIAINGEHFSMQRMLHEYLRRGYRL